MENGLKKYKQQCIMRFTILSLFSPVLQPVSCEIFPSSSLLSQAAIYAKVNRSKVLTWKLNREEKRKVKHWLSKSTQQSTILDTYKNLS